MTDRRHFLKSIALGTGIAFTQDFIYAKGPTLKTNKIACQHYTWSTYFEREGKSWMENPDSSFKEFSKSGFTGFEPFFSSPSEVFELNRHMQNNNIWSKSMYINSVLHEPQLVEQNIQNILAVSKEVKKIGIDIIVTNPTPIKWGGAENKNDEQLKAQAIALNLLGKKLKSIGVSLAYHNHDAEMREGAREFHHMLTATDPDNVKLCLDAHWIYRGSGNSQIALFDIVEHYSNRIIELHLRQSHNGIWSEVFEEGDIDYSRLASVLKKKGLNPHIVMEQAIEMGTPHTMNTVEAMQKSLSHAENIFEKLN